VSRSATVMPTWSKRRILGNGLHAPSLDRQFRLNVAVRASKLTGILCRRRDPKGSSDRGPRRTPLVAQHDDSVAESVGLHEV
jgi:hypothetical protein